MGPFFSSGFAVDIKNRWMDGMMLMEEYELI